MSRETAASPPPCRARGCTNSDSTARGGSTRTSSRALNSRLSLRDPVTLAIAIAAGVGWFGFPGLLWDVAWHRTIGRDSFLSPPHLLMYAGVAASGLVAAWAVVSRVRRPGFPLVVAGFALAMAGAVLDEAWHRFIGKDVNLWSPPHLTGLAGTMVIALGLVLAVAAQTRYGTRPDWWPPRVLLLFFFADLLHKSMVALDHYTLDAWGRTADFYPFLVALMQPAILAAAAHAVGTGGATGTALVFVVQHVVILSILEAAGMRIPTFSPFPILPALALDAVLARSGRAAAAIVGGLAFVVALYAQEAAWMRWVVGRPWAIGDIGRALPAALLAGAASAWVGWVIGVFVRSAARHRPATEAFGSRRRVRVTVAAMALVIALGAIAAYRPSRREPPATLAQLGLAADIAFDHRDATFWTALLPDDWAQPGDHETYQEAVIDGRPVPLGPAWCAADERTLARTVTRIRFGLSINGADVALERYPVVRHRLRDGTHCQWIGVSAMTPRPGDQRIVYTLHYPAPVESSIGTVGPGTSRIVVTLRVKEP